MGATRADKALYFEKLKELLAKYPSIFLVNVDNVGSNQMHQIRGALRGKGVVLMGKNTMVRRALRSILAENPQFERLLPYVKGNIGFVFTSQDLKEIREIIVANKVAAPARAGAFAPKDVTVPASNTGMEPGKTSFFQALGIPTKIARGTIEIVSDVKVVTAGTRVGTSEATLLNMLNISPFTYGMTVIQIFDQGNIFSPEVLDVDEQELIDRFLSGIKTIAAISLALNYPTIVSVSHTLVHAYKNLLAISLATEYTFEASEKVCSFLVARVGVLKIRLLYTLKILSISRMHGGNFISIMICFYHFKLERSMLISLSDQGVPCQPRRVRCCCPRCRGRCCSCRCRCRRGEGRGEGGIGRRHGLRIVRLSVNLRGSAVLSTSRVVLLCSCKNIIIWTRKRV
ncbi:ribosomal protein L10-domain-containing protein [Flammula alnicola]|nr:ribosomal protein L10-domain-containing protein [Flammula alnicola]